MDAIGSLIQLAILVVVVIGMWKVFVKAGHPGWASIIPIYNLYILTQIAGRPWWWLLLCFIPLVNLVIVFILSVDIARKFGKGVGFAIGMFFLSFIFYPILGFSDATYSPTA